MADPTKRPVVIVTGVGGGIGASISRSITEFGWKPLGIDRVSRVGVDVVADLTNPTEISERVSPVLADHSDNLMGLVNAAGMGYPEPFLEADDESWYRVIDANLMTTVRMCREVLPYLLRNKGNRSIVNFGSQAGKTGGIVIGAHYSAAKAAVMCLTKSLALAYGPEGIRVNAVAPGIIETAFLDQVPSMKDRGPTLPLRRLGSPEDVASVVMFLLSEGAGYLTGEIVDVNGGLLMD